MATRVVRIATTVAPSRDPHRRTGPAGWHVGHLWTARGAAIERIRTARSHIEPACRAWAGLRHSKRHRACMSSRFPDISGSSSLTPGTRKGYKGIVCRSFGGNTRLRAFCLVAEDPLALASWVSCASTVRSVRFLPSPQPPAAASSPSFCNRCWSGHRHAAGQAHRVHRVDEDDEEQVEDDSTADVVR